MEQPTGNGARNNLSHRAVSGLSITQIIIGSLLILFGVVIISIHGAISFIGAPIWGGIFFLITGVLGVLAARWKQSSLIVSSMVMCIISAAVVFPALFGTMVTTLIIESFNCDYYYGSDSGAGCHSRQSTRMGIEGVILMLGFVDFIVAIVNSAFCCGAVCCRSSAVVPIVYYTSHPGGMPQQFPMATMQGGQQVIILSSGTQNMPPPVGTYQTQSAFQQPVFVPTAGASAAYGQVPGMYDQYPQKGEELDTSPSPPPAYS